MKPVSLIVIVSASFALFPAVAHADEKADAILKEVRVRMSSTAAYSVTILLEDNKERLSMRFLMQHPDKFRLELFEKNKIRTVILNGQQGAYIEKGKIIPLSDANVHGPVDSMKTLVFANFERMLGGIKSTTYITQKTLDEKTVVDVIDVVGKRPGDSARVYIDNNSQIQKIVGKSSTTQGTIYFLNPTTDPLITEKTFAVE